MANQSASVRAWTLLQQMEAAYINGSYAQASVLSDMARAYMSLTATTGDDALTAWFSHAQNANPLIIDFTVQTVTDATVPTDAEVIWNFNDGSTTVTNKVLNTNVATLTTAAAHGLQVGNKVVVAISDAVFDGLQTVTAVTSTTFSFAKTNANVGTAAATGTAKPAGLTFSKLFSGNDSYYVTVTVDTAALGAVTYGRYVKVPYSIG